MSLNQWFSICSITWLWHTHADQTVLIHGTLLIFDDSMTLNIDSNTICVDFFACVFICRGKDCKWYNSKELHATYANQKTDSSQCAVLFLILNIEKVWFPFCWIINIIFHSHSNLTLMQFTYLIPSIFSLHWFKCSIYNDRVDSSFIHFFTLDI